jgi:hypothetical protein
MLSLIANTRATPCEADRSSAEQQRIEDATTDHREMPSTNQAWTVQAKSVAFLIPLPQRGMTCEPQM